MVKAEQMFAQLDEDGNGDLTEVIFVQRVKYELTEVLFVQCLGQSLYRGCTMT